jgi:transposase
MRKQNAYSSEFIDDALKLLDRTNRSLPDVARDLGVPVATLRYWHLSKEASAMAKKKGRRQPRARVVKAAAARAAAEETAEEKLARLEREMDALRKENDELRMDREILKKAAAFFAKESE